MQTTVNQLNKLKKIFTLFYTMLIIRCFYVQFICINYLPWKDPASCKNARNSML